MSVSETDLISPTDAASRLRLSKQRVYQLVRNGHLQGYKKDNRIHLSAREVDELKAKERPTGRPSADRAFRHGLPSSSPEIRAAVRAALLELCMPHRQDIFRKARGGAIPLASVKLDLKPTVQAYISEALTARSGAPTTKLSEEDAHGLLAELSRDEEVDTRLIATETTYQESLLVDSLKAWPVINFLTLNEGLRLDQSVLIYGAPGTLKSSLVATMAVLCAGETGKPVLVYAIEESTKETQALLTRTLQAWRKQPHASQGFFQEIEVLAANQVDFGRLAGPKIVVQGAAGAWSELLEEIRQSLDECPDAVAVMVDSIGPLGHISRRDLGDLVTLILRLHGPNRMAVLVAEESQNTESLFTLEQASFYADLVIHLRADLPEKPSARLTTRYLEISKSRKQPFLTGRHALELPIEGIITIDPAVDAWDDCRISVTPPREYHPGFSSASRDQLRALDEMVRPWTVGSSMVLVGPRGTFKEHLCLYAAARAVEEGTSVIFLSLRQNYVNVLKNTIRDYPDIYKVLSGKLVPYDPESIGDTPQVHLTTVSLAHAPAERWLWSLYRGIEQSFGKKSPVGLVMAAHFSELLLLPGFSPTIWFGQRLFSLLSRLKVALLTQADEDTWKRNLLAEAIQDLLPLFSVRLDLEHNDPDRSLVAATTQGRALILKRKTDPEAEDRQCIVKVLPADTCPATE
jgi:excisionase family DNA binding protein